MRAFIARMEMVFVSTADARGNCDCSLRAGPPGFVRAVDAHTLLYPEYRGNGVMASQGNITENGHIGLLFIDFCHSTVGLHVNGRARLLEAADPDAPRDGEPSPPNDHGGPPVERWVAVEVDEAYIHCAKHVPLLVRRDKPIAWGTDDERRKGGDYFGASRTRRGGAPAGADRPPAR